ncbi:hypothetical protein TU77_19070 [Pseudomonas synxantha]|nr:hypothetical protein TU77_19070 [Pseudomonas synxantha]
MSRHLAHQARFKTMATTNAIRIRDYGLPASENIGQCKGLAWLSRLHLNLCKTFCTLAVDLMGCYCKK